jgi:orotidine-5'-phosphate decarboxylase
MTSYKKAINIIKNKESLLCVGLDSDISKIPHSLFSADINGLYDFNRAIIENTKEFATAYKINFAFYEQYGSDGFNLIKKTLELIPSNIFTIADAKRCDISNSSAGYSKSVFDSMNFDSVTVNAYMGIDSVAPFLENKNKMVFVLALTSNPGSNDFQRLMIDKKPLYEHIIEKVNNSFATENIGFVIGATHSKELNEIRKKIENNFILIPGVGVQGGNIADIVEANNNLPAFINVSRGIIYPEVGNFNEKVSEMALYYKNAFNKA